MSWNEKPWRAYYDERAEVWKVRSAANFRIVTDLDEDTARLIVEACNSYDANRELLEAAKRVVYSTSSNPVGWHKHMLALESAIEKVESRS